MKYFSLLIFPFSLFAFEPGDLFDILREPNNSNHLHMSPSLNPWTVTSVEIETFTAESNGVTGTFNFSWGSNSPDPFFDESNPLTSDPTDTGTTVPDTETNPWGFEGTFNDSVTGYHLIEGSDYWGGACDYVFGITYLFEFRFLPTGGFCTVTPDSFFIEDYYFQTDPIKTDPNMPFSWLVQYQQSKLGLYNSSNQLINPLETTNGVGNQKFRIPIYGIDQQLSFGGTVNYSFNMTIGIKGTYVVVDHIGNKTGQQVPYSGKYDHLVTYNVSENISISYTE